MIEAYKVGVSLVLDSNTTLEVGKVSRQFEQLDRIIKGAQRSVNELAAGLRGLSRIGQAAADAWTVAAQAMERAARASVRAGQAMPGPGGGGGGGGGAMPQATTGRGPPPPFYPPVAIGAPTGGAGGGRGLVVSGGGGAAGGGPGGMPSLALPPANTANGNWMELIADYLAVRQSMREDVALRSALMSLGFKPGDSDFAGGIKSLRGLAADSAVGTIFSEARVGEAMPAAAGVLGFGGSDEASRAEAMAKFAKIYPTIVRLGEVAEMQHMGSMSDSMVAAISYAHMTNRYDPKDLEPGLDRLMNVARLTHETVAGEQAVLKYSVPIGQAAGMKADDIAGLTGFLQVLGFSGTTAGTGLGQLISGLAPISITKHGASAKAKALQAMGLMDDKGAINEDVAPGGHVDAMALLKHIAEYAKTNKPINVLKTLREAFTVRGMRVAGAMENEESVPRLLTYMEQLNRLPSARATQEALAQSPMQAFEQMVARTADVGNTLATATLPALKTAFESITAAVGGTNEILRKDPQAATATGAGLLGLAGSNLLRLGIKGLKWSGLGGGAMEAGLGAGARTLGAAGGLGLLFGLGKTGIDVMESGDAWLYDQMWGKGEWDRTHKSMSGGAKSLFGIGSAHASEPIPVKMEAGATEGMATTIGNAVKSALVGIGINLDGKKVGEVVAGRMADRMSRPSTGTNAPDLRISPWMPGVVGGF